MVLDPPPARDGLAGVVDRVALVLVEVELDLLHRAVGAVERLEVLALGRARDQPVDRALHRLAAQPALQLGQQVDLAVLADDDHHRTAAVAGEVADGRVVAGPAARVTGAGRHAVEDDAHRVHAAVGADEHGAVDAGRRGEHPAGEAGRRDRVGLRQQPVGLGGGVGVHHEHRAVGLLGARDRHVPEVAGVASAHVGEHPVDRVGELLLVEALARQLRQAVVHAQQRGGLVPQLPGAVAADRGREHVVAVGVVGVGEAAQAEHLTPVAEQVQVGGRHLQHLAERAGQPDRHRVLERDLHDQVGVVGLGEQDRPRARPALVRLGRHGVQGVADAVGQVLPGPLHQRADEGVGRRPQQGVRVDADARAGDLTVELAAGRVQHGIDGRLGERARRVVGGRRAAQAGEVVPVLGVNGDDRDDEELPHVNTDAGEVHPLTGPGRLGELFGEHEPAHLRLGRLECRRVVARLASCGRAAKALVGPHEGVGEDVAVEVASGRLDADPVLGVVEADKVGPRVDVRTGTVQYLVGQLLQRPPEPGLVCPHPHGQWCQSEHVPASHGEQSVERATGIEPACPAWEAGALPLSYARVLLAQPRHHSHHPNASACRPTAGSRRTEGRLSAHGARAVASWGRTAGAPSGVTRVAPPSRRPALARGVRRG